MKNVFVAGRSWNLYDIAQISDLSIEELNYCSRTELAEIVLDYLNK